MNQNQNDIFSGNLGLAAVIAAVILAITALVLLFAFPISEGGLPSDATIKVHKGNPCYYYEGIGVVIMSKATWCQSYLDLQIHYYGWKITSSDERQIYLAKSIID